MTFRSSYPDVEIPDLSLTEYVLGDAASRADKPALVDGATGRVVTYGELVRLVRASAAGLAARGFGKGDVLAIYSCNLPEYAVAFHAVASLGGVNTTANPLFGPDELAKQLRDSEARMLVTAPPLLDTAIAAAERAGGVEEIFVYGDAGGATPFASLLEGGGEPPPVAIDPAEDLVALPYSSGTSGMPSSWRRASTSMARPRP